MLILRFQRVGKKHDTTFRVVAVDSRFSSKSGKVKEVLGWWDPRKDKFELKTERINYWLKNGAQTSDSCYNLLIKAKIIEGKKRQVVIHQKKAKEGEETIAKPEAPKTEKEPVAENSGEPTSTEPISESTKAKEDIKAESNEEPKSKEKIEQESENSVVKEDVDSN